MLSMNLTVSLSILAAAVLAGLAVQGWWRVRRDAAARRLAQPESAAARIEPSLGAQELGEPADAGDTLPDDPVAALHSRRLPRLDALIDALATVSLDAPVSGEMALAHMPGSHRAGTKPMFIEGRDMLSGEWETPSAGGRYTEFQAGVQLANRVGALNEIEFSEFVQKVQAFAEGVSGTVDLPDMLDVVARARELDTFASPLDAQLSLVLKANSVAWSLGYVQQCAGRQGFVPGSLPGRLVLPGASDGDPPVLVLGFDPQTALEDDPQTALRELRLSLDLAQSPESIEPFPLWHRAATALCEEMDATAVDDNGMPVTLHAFDAIGREVGALYRQLEMRGLPAGSPVARRLFS